MKILLVDPLVEDEKLLPRLIERFTRSYQQSLTFPILAARSPERHSLEFIQGNLQNIDFEEKYDLIGISSITSNAPLAYDIADKFRRKHIPVVLGGWHPSALPNEAKLHADSVVIGEAEETWPQLLQDAEHQKLKPFYIQTRPVDPENIPAPRTDLLKKGKNVIVLATRGCINRCEFCAIANMIHRRHFRTRAVRDVINEIEKLPGKTFIFYDDCLTIDASFTKQLFMEMKGLNKKFVAMGTTNRLAQDDELLRLASEAGCISWAVGFESLSQTTLDSIGKRTNKVTQYPQAIKKMHDYGMWIQGWFVFGFDQDTLDTFSYTAEFVRRNEVDLPEPLILTPFPRTPLYDRLEKGGRLLTMDWRMYDTKHVVFQPLQLTSEELYTRTLELHKEWYDISTIMKRTLSSTKYGLATFLSTPSRNFFKRTHGPQA
jgi:radical SAM superfamily enzyme YgiQ (UPF0313 family)